jgi:hypothetical protein
MRNYNKITASSGLISLGNTGARLSDPRATYVKILNALIEFRKKNKDWENTDQISFGEFLGELEIFEIKTNNKVSSDKDVRVKTGFISQLGFTTEQRVVTNAGRELILNSLNFETNEFDISKDSFTYLKQFLKYQQDDFKILPLLSLLYAVIEFNNELPIEFVTYVWPSSQTTKELIDNIKIYKKNADYKETIYHSILKSEKTNFVLKDAKSYFAKHSIADKNKLKELLYSILPHGKGNTFKDKAIALFYDVYIYWSNKEIWNETRKKKYIQERLKSRYKDISSKKPNYYLEGFFGTVALNNSSDWKKIISFFEKTPLLNSDDEESFVVNFHIIYMFIKKLSLCDEYKDLNIRHLKLLDIFITEYGKLKLDIVFWYLFKSVKDKLLQVEPLPQSEYRKKLEASQNSIGEIYDFLKINISVLSRQIEADFPEVKNLGLKDFVLKKKEERLLELVNTIFTKENIITIFENIYPRKDERIRELIKEWYQEYEATIPALFEYLLGISFYWISGRKVRISDILNSGLDSNLLPKTHAAGGQADIVVRGKGRDYLIEATLSESDGQRQMEAEPVPRHLAKHLLEKNPNTLALFVAGKLDRNNLVSLRSYKFNSWYFSDDDFVKSMDILPLSVSNMIFLLKNNDMFEEIESKFDSLVNSESSDGFQWYKNEVNPTFSS